MSLIKANGARVARQHLEFQLLIAHHPGQGDALACQQAAQAHPGLVFRWVDVEDEAAAVGDLDVETFPTLVIGAADGGVRFAGPVLPQAAQIPRLLKSLGL